MVIDFASENSLPGTNLELGDKLDIVMRNQKDISTRVPF